MESIGAEWKAARKRRRGHIGKTVWQPESVKRSEKEVAKHVEAVPRKAAIVHTVPVPKTDTGG